MRESDFLPGTLGVTTNFAGNHAGVLKRRVGRLGPMSRALQMVAVLGPACSISVGYAQDADAPRAPELEEIIVTGTLIRGADPAGTNVIGVSSEAIQETGATTTAQLLQNIPQFGSFNTLAFPGGVGNTLTTNRPNLRSLPGFNNSGGSTTLVLMDGHRIVGAGITSTSPDPDIIPPGVIERVEIVPDGGSAVYGSDAVAGVINFITRKRFEGLEVDGHYGIADSYHQSDANITAGTAWESGGAYVSYNYSEHGNIFGRDRDYVRQFPIELIGGLPVTNIQCSSGNVVQGGRVFALPFNTATAVAGTANQCDESDHSTIYPTEDRHSALASISHELNDAVELEVKGFFTTRDIQLINGPYRFTQPVAGAASSQFFNQHNVGSNQSVRGQFGAVDASQQDIELETWGVTPTLTVDIGTSWQMRLVGSSSQSTTSSHADGVNTTAMTRATNANLFNPYDPTASDPAALAAITDYEVYGKTKQRLDDVRAVFDGDLLTLPGGAIKVALGGEYYRERFDTRKGETVPGFAASGFTGLTLGGNLIVAPIAAVPAASLTRNVRAAFGEVIVPIFGDENARPGLHELTLSAAGRYDDYNDFGDTFNPRFGLTYKPFDWLKLHASQGKSFVAPSLADAEQSEVTQVIQVPAAAFAPPPNLVQDGTYPAIASGQFALGVRGNSPGIGPQNAETLSFGFQITPPFAPALDIGLTYYKIEFEGVIGLPPVGGPATATLYRDYPFLIQTAPTTTQILDTLAASDIPVTACTPLPTCVYAILDIRKRNLGNFNLDGIDLNASYRPETSFGQLFFSVNGTHELTREQSAASNLPYSDLLKANNSRFRVRTSAGAQIGKLLSQVTWNYTEGFDLDPFAGVVAPQQTEVDAFDVVNLYFRYDVDGQRMLENLSVSLNVDNVFDEDPPEFRGVVSRASTSGFFNGNTLGRLFQLGIKKKF